MAFFMVLLFLQALDVLDILPKTYRGVLMALEVGVLDVGLRDAGACMRAIINLSQLPPLCPHQH